MTNYITLPTSLRPDRVSTFVTQLDYVSPGRFGITNNGEIIDAPKTSVPQRIIAHLPISPGGSPTHLLGQLQRPDVDRPEQPVDIRNHPITTGFRVREGSNDGDTAIYDAVGALRFNRWPCSEYTRYFDGLSASSTYHEMLMGLNLEHFKIGYLETAPYSWLNALNPAGPHQGFYPARQLCHEGFYPAGQPMTSPDFSFLPGEYLTRRRAIIKTDEKGHIVYDENGQYIWLEKEYERRFPPIQHIVDWTTGRVAGVGNQVREAKETFRVEDPIADLVTYETTISGTLFLFNRYVPKKQHSAALGSYIPGYQIRFLDPMGYTSYDGEFFSYHDGPYASYEFNIPLLTDGDRIIIFRYQKELRCKPHPDYDDATLIYTDSVKLSLFSVDTKLRDWQEITLDDLAGTMTWPTPAERIGPTSIFGLPIEGPFAFGATNPTCLFTPWTYRGRLYVHAPYAPYTSVSTRNLPSGMRITTYTYSTGVVSYPLTGGKGTAVHINTNLRDTQPALPTLFLDLYSGPSPFEQNVRHKATMGRFFVADKNFQLKQTSKVKT